MTLFERLVVDALMDVAEVIVVAMVIVVVLTVLRQLNFLNVRILKRSMFLLWVDPN